MPTAGRSRFSPNHVLDMAEMKFTTHAISARGKGQAKGVPVYSKAKKLAVRDLAALVVAPGGGINNGVWMQLKEKGILSGFRSRKDGSIISFAFDGKRIRLATLHRFLDQPQQPQTKGNTMPTASIQPDQPLPDSIAAKLAKAGFTTKDLASLTTNLRSAKVLTHTATETKQPNPPTTPTR